MAESNTFDLASLMQSTTAANKQNEGISAIMNNSVSQLDAALRGIAETGSGTTTVNGKTVTELSLNTSLLADLDAQNKLQEIKSSLGMSGEGSADIRNVLGQTLVAATQEHQAQTAKVAELKSVGLFDNPLEFLINQVLLPDENNKLKATQAKVESAAGDMQKINQFAQESAVTENAYKQSITQASIADLTRAAANDIKQKDYKEQITAIATGNSTLAQTMAANDVQLNNINRVLQAKNAAISLGLQQKSFGMEQEKFELHKKQVQIALDKWDEDQASQKALIDSLNIGLKDAGRQILEGPDASIKARTLLNMQGPEGDKWRKLATVGLTRLASGSLSYGGNVTEIIDYIRTTNPVISDPRQKALVSTLAQAESLAIKNNPMIKEGTEAFKLAVNKEMVALVKNEDVVASGALDYRKAPPVTVMAEQAAVKSDPVFQTVIAPLLVGKGLDANSTDQQVYDSVIAAARKGQVNPNAAGEFITKYFTAAVALNNDQVNPTKFGFPTQLNYTMAVHQGLSEKSSGAQLATTAGAGLMGAGAYMAATGVGAPVGAAAIAGGGTLLALAGNKAQSSRLLNVLDSTSVTNQVMLEVYKSKTASRLFGVGNEAVAPLMIPSR